MYKKNFFRDILPWLVGKSYLETFNADYIFALYILTWLMLRNQNNILRPRQENVSLSQKKIRKTYVRNAWKKSSSLNTVAILLLVKFALHFSNKLKSYRVPA